MSTKTFLSTEAARGLQVKHSKLMRDLDRVRSILTPEKADALMLPIMYTDTKGTKRAYALTQACGPFLLAGQASKAQIRWLAEVWG